jgi:superfamily I DNA and/or RNA helicase
VIGQCEAEIIVTAEIGILTTCAAGGARFNSFRPQCLIIDEANQIINSELLSVLRFNLNQLTL